jgi:hypothetical protein
LRTDRDKSAFGSVQGLCFSSPVKIATVTALLVPP